MSKVNLAKNIIYINIQAEQIRTLIDTGSDISAISLAVLHKINIKQTHINPANITHVRAAAGTRHSVTGQVQLSLTIGDATIQHTFYIIPSLHHKCILGTDFLSKHSARLNYEDSTLTFRHNDNYNNINFLQVGPKINIKPFENTTLPKYSARIVRIKILGAPDNETLLLSPNSIVKELGLTLHKSIIRNTSDACVLLINKSSSDITVYRQCSLAKGSIIQQTRISSLSSNNDIEDALSANLTNTNINSLQNDDDIQHNKTHQLTENQKNIQFDLSKADLTPDQKERLTNLLDNYRHIFATDITELGTTTYIQHTIETTDEIPVRSRPYKTTPEMKQKIEEEVERLLDAGIIEHSTSNYASPVVMVKKKRTDLSKPQQWRLVLDYRKLNKKIKTVLFPLPLLDQACDTIGQNKSKIFSILDAKSGYYNIPLDPATKHKTAFITHHGLFNLLKTPMGLSTSCQVFQLLMNKVFKGLIWKHILVFIDDILIFSKDFDEHIQILTEVFNRLTKADIKLAPDKCSFAKNTVTFLGNTITKNGIAVCPNKTQGIDELPVPKTIKQLRCVLGKFNFYRRYIKDFSRTAFPLYQLLNKNNHDKSNKISWTAPCDRAFNDLKTALKTSPILCYPSPDREYFLITDGCQQGISFILMQPDGEGKLKPVAYGSRTLRKEQTRWPIMQIELFAIIMGLREYRNYLINKPFTILTDCKNLTWLNKTDHSNGRLLRWQFEISQYNFKITHIKGHQNIIADAASRLPSATLAPEESQEFEIDIFSIYPEVIESDQISNNNDQPTAKRISKQTHTICAPSISKIMSTNNHAPSTCALTSSTHQTADTHPPHTDNPDTQTHINVYTQPFNIGKLQSECQDISGLYRYLKYDTLPECNKTAKQIVIEASQYEMKDGKLYHLFQPRTKNKTTTDQFIYQLVVPKNLRLKLLQAYHDDHACHLGFNKLYEILKLKYFWKGMYQHTYDFVTSCQICQTTKRSMNTRITPLHPYQIDGLFTRWHMDILSGLPTTKNKNKHILLFIESFSNWPEAIPLKSQDSNSIAEAIYENIFTRWGVPSMIVSDNAANLHAKIINLLCTAYKVKRPKIAAYKPSSNGKVEIANSHLLKRLRALTSNHPERWDEYLSATLLSLRLAPNVNTSGYSPFKIITGLEMNLDVDILDTPRVTGDVKLFIDNMHKRIEITRQSAADNILKSQQVSKLLHDKKAKQPAFKIGDHVLLKIEQIPTGKPRKLFAKYKGKYCITRAGKNNSYQLLNCNTDKLLKCYVHASRLKPFKDRDDFFHFNNAEDQNDDNQNDDPLSETENAQTQSQVISKTQPNNDQWYKVDKLLKSKLIKGTRHYLVKWSNPRYQSEWIKSANIAPRLKEIYHASRPIRKRRY